jgi:hypothetical protein
MSTIKTFNDACKDTCSALREIIIKKQHDYGKNNILEFGEMGVLIRSNDKFSRLKNLILKSKNPSNEPKIDTWYDIAGYAILAIMLENKTFDLPLEEDKKDLF